MQKFFFLPHESMKIVQEQTLSYSLEIEDIHLIMETESESEDEIVNEPDDNVISELSDHLVKMHDLVSDINAIDEAIEVSKYILKYNCRLPYTKYDLNLMRSVEDQVLTLLVDISDELDSITIYDNYVEA